MKKRILSIVLALGIGLTQLPMTSFAADAVHVETFTQAGTDEVSGATVETQAAADTGAKQGAKAQENTESTAVEKQPENEKKQNGENTEDSEKKSVGEQTSRAEEASKKDVAEAKSETEVQPSSEVKKDAEKKADSDAKQETKESSEKNADAEKQTESAAKEAKKTASETTPKQEQKAEAASTVTADEVQKQIDALPGAENITEETKAVVMAQLDAIDALKGKLSDEEGQKLDFTRYDAAAAAVMALNGENNEIATLAAQEYDLAVNGFWFDSEQLTYTNGSGTAVYDPKLNTLTLKNLNFTSDWTKGAVIYSKIDGLKIIVSGTNTITMPASLNNKTDAIRLIGNNATITGANGASSDQLIINSTCAGSTDAWEDGTTRSAITYHDGSLNIEKLTLTMNDTSSNDYKGHSTAVYSNSTGKLTMKNCVLNTTNTQHGVYMNQGAAEISYTAFNIQNGSISNSTGVNLAPGTKNKLTNCDGTISATYPVYTYGKLDVSGNEKLTLKGSEYAIVVKQYNSSSEAAEATFTNVNIEANAPSGIDLEGKSMVTLKSGTLAVTAGKYGMRLGSNATFTAKNGTLNINSTGDASAAILSGGTVKFTGGNHILTAKAAGYAASGTNSALQISAGTVTINAPVGVQTDSSTKGSVTISGGTTNLNCTTAGMYKDSGSGETTITGGAVNINCTVSGIQTLNGAGKTSITGGKVTITDTNKSSAATGINAGGEMEIGGTAEVAFKNCKYDIQSTNSKNKISGGTVELSASKTGLLVVGNFSVTGGNITSTGNGYGIYGANDTNSIGTITLSSGTVDLSSSDYPMIAYQNCIFDFAGAKVTLNTTKNYALVIYDDGSSYKVTDGEVILKSTQAGANKMYTSLADGYGVWAGASDSEAKPVSNPTSATLNNKYVRIAKKQSYTLTLVDVKEGESASVYAGADITYTAKDPQSGKHFSHWERTVGNNPTTVVGTKPTYTGTMPASNATLKAVYEICSGGTATCEKRAVCEKCGKEYGNLNAHVYTARKAETAYLKTEATCQSPAVYYKSCAVCGASSKGQTGEATFTSGNLTDHVYTAEKAEVTYLKTEATCQSPAVYYKSCAVCGTSSKGQSGEETFASGNLAAHVFTAERAEAAYLKTAATSQSPAVYYKSCEVCGASSKGQTGEATFTSGSKADHDFPGSGTAEAPYRISTAAHLKQFCDAVNNGEYGAHAVLENNINLGGEAWTPIGSNENNAYTGTFDGGGHTVSGLYVSLEFVRAKEAGLFGNTKNATIRNLTVSGSVSIDTLSASDRAGGIVGMAEGGTIENCGNLCTVRGSTAGGIAGKTVNVTVSGCYNGGRISSGYDAAGIVGYFGGGSGKIYDCYNVGTVHGQLTAGGIIIGAAGIGVAYNCYNTATVTSGYAYGISYKVDAKNCFLLKGATADSKATEKSAEEFADGTVLGLLKAGEHGNNAAPWADECKYVAAAGRTLPVFKWQTGDAHTHDQSSKWESNDVQHWQVCSCGAVFHRADHNGGTATCTEKAVCAVCDTAYGTAPGHDFSDDWAHNADTHWNPCSRCKAKKNEDAHVWDNGKITKQPTCTTEGEKTYTCTICSVTKTESVNATGHSWKSEWTSDATHHWHDCANETCDVADNSGKDGYAEHIGGTATCTEKAVCEVCGTAYGTALGHDSSDDWVYNADTHWNLCSRCNEKQNEVPHVWDNGKVTKQPTCITEGEKTYTCTVCSATKTESVNTTGHSWKSEWTSDATHHWHDCANAICDVTDNSGKNRYAEHIGGTATCTAKAICEICGKAYGDVNPKHHSSLKKIEKAEATVAKTGHTEYWQCGACQKLFSDASAVTEIKEADTILPKSQPEIIDGKKATWKDTDKKGLEIRSDAPVEDFVDVLVDGKVLSEKEYTVTDKEGTLITLKPSYLKKLGTGKYKIVVRSESGDAETTFRVEKAALKAEKVDDTKKKTNTPATGDESDFILWLLLILVSGGVVAATAVVKKKRR